MNPLIPSACFAILTVFGEARSEPYEGQVAVGNVIRNRMRLKYQSDGTIVGTVLRPYAFSGWNTNDKQRIRVCRADLNDPALKLAMKAWDESETRQVVPVEAVLYHADYVTPTWDFKQLVHVATIGRHLFFKEKR